MIRFQGLASQRSSGLAHSPVETLKKTKMENKNKPWNALEMSFLYHLCIWGYNSEEVSTIAKPFLKQRTDDGIRGQASVVRKYISKQKGYVVSNYDLSNTTESLIKKGGKISPTEALIKFEKHADFIPARVVNKTPVRTKTKPVAEQSIVSQFENTLSEPKQNQPEAVIPTNEEPNIIDVMRLAKELGATEVEYKGVKIKY